MKISGRKVTSFITTGTTLISFYILTLFFAPEQLEHIGKFLILLFFANGAIFITFNSLDKFLYSLSGNKLDKMVDKLPTFNKKENNKGE